MGNIVRLAEYSRKKRTQQPKPYPGSVPESPFYHSPHGEQFENARIAFWWFIAPVVTVVLGVGIIAGFFLLFLYALGLILGSPAYAQTLERNGSIVTISQGNGFSIKFYGLYGGTPLSWYMNGTLTTEDFGGEGVQIVYDSGQDGTQSSATGLDYYPIAQIGKPDTYKYAYFGLEEVAEAKNGKAVYQTSSFLPYFWVSLEEIDDAIPSDPRGKHRWSTYYNDILGLGFDGYHTNGTPIFFSGNPQVPSGILLVGDEIRSIYFPEDPWYERINHIPAGRFALRMRISMQHAGMDSIAGILLRKDLTAGPASNVHTVYAAKGQQLNINRIGAVQLVSNGVPIWTAPTQYWAAHKLSLDSPGGLQVEIRTHNWATDKMEIYINERMLGIVSAPVQGESFGIFGSGTTGPIKFFDRQIIDVGTRCTSRWETTPQGTMLATLSVYRVAAPAQIPMYRVNLPVAFVKSRFRETTFVWNQNWNAHGPASLHALFPDGWVPYVAPNWQARAMWSGTQDGRFGIFIKPKLPLPVNGQFISAPSVQAHTTLPYSANFTPVPFVSEKMAVEVFPSIRWDLLH